MTTKYRPQYKCYPRIGAVSRPETGTTTLAHSFGIQIASGLFVFALYTLATLVPALAATKYSKIIYSETTKSYFQYVLHDATNPKNWVEASAEASRLQHNGLRGRLAVVSDAKVNDLLRRNFAPQHWTWIGLRYICSAKRSLWTSGHVLKRTDYQNWAPVWYRTKSITCAAQPRVLKFMPVYYTYASAGFRWRASGPAKRMQGYFVEYPAGEQ